MILAAAYEDNDKPLFYVELLSLTESPIIYSINFYIIFILLSKKTKSTCKSIKKISHHSMGQNDPHLDTYLVTPSCKFCNRALLRSKVRYSLRWPYHQNRIHMHDHPVDCIFLYTSVSVLD